MYIQVRGLLRIKMYTYFQFFVILQRLCLSATLGTSWDVDRVDAAEAALSTAASSTQAVDAPAAVSASTNRRGSSSWPTSRVSSSTFSDMTPAALTPQPQSEIDQSTAAPESSADDHLGLRKEAGSDHRKEKEAILRQAAIGCTADSTGRAGSSVASAHELLSAQHWMVTVGAPAAHALGFKGGGGLVLSCMC
jgi:hypothetical protein